MSNPERNESQTESMLSNLLKFFFIFFILVVIILSLHFTGFLDSDETNATTTAASIQTLPTTETTTAETTTPITTESPTTETTPIVTTETTTADIITYPPATVPSNTKTTAVTTTQTTAATTEPPSTGSLDVSDKAMADLIDVRYLSIDDNSRPGYKLWSVKNIVVHYVANPKSTADQNWRHFENNKPGTSAHFIIGLEGEIIQCIPLDEVAWAIGTKDGNYTSISIECCHPDSTGKFTDATYESLVRLVSWLCGKLKLDRDDVIRHYDYPRYTANGVEWHKECPLYYADADNPASHKRWEAFKDDLILD